MPRGVNTAFHPARVVSTPTPDGGISSEAAGPIIQENWERMRDSGMSGPEATARLHTLTPTVSASSGRAPAEGTNPSWLNSQQMGGAPNNATMHGPTIPSSVRHPDPTWNPGPSLGSTIVNNLTHWTQPPTTPTNSYGQAGQILNRYVVEQA